MGNIDANTGRGRTFPPASSSLECVHVGLGELRMTDMWNDKQCDNMVCVSGPQALGPAQLHIARLTVPDAMARVQQ